MKLEIPRYTQHLKPLVQIYRIFAQDESTPLYFLVNVTLIDFWRLDFNHTIAKI